MFYDLMIMLMHLGETCLTGKQQSPIAISDRLTTKVNNIEQLIFHNYGDSQQETGSYKQ
jgi:carbonic anhydrase